MRFSNFEMEEPIGAITLVGLGHLWDLHNSADLVRAELDGDGKTALVEWRVPSGVENPWGSPGNSALGCRIVFRGVNMFDRRAGIRSGGDRDSKTVAGISKAIPDEVEFPFRSSWAEGAPFYLRIETEDGGRIDIGAESATLEAIPRLDV